MLSTFAITLVLLSANFAVNGQSTVPPNSRIDCDPTPNSNQGECTSRGCIWDSKFDSNNPTVPLCYYPPNTGYNATSTTKTTATLKPVPGGVGNPYGSNYPNLQFTWKSLGSAVKIQIAPTDVTRYRPPVDINENANIQSSEAFTVEIVNKNIFSFNVKRKSNGVRIWDTSIGGLLFADQFIQISTYLPSKKIYGFGEHIHKNLQHDFSKYTTWGMFARDEPPDSAGDIPKNLYGVHPFYLGLEDDGKAYGVFIFNSNAQEVVTGPAPHLTYRTIGGQLEVFFFPGPKPEDVVQQYQQIIGTPFLPAYWALGFQLCRYGYTGVDEVKETVKRLADAGIPQDVQFADIDYMDRYKDFTYDHNKWAAWPNFTDELHSMGKRVTLIFDPAIQADYDSFKRGIDSNASFIEWPTQDAVMKNINDQYPYAKNTKVMLGVVWPDKHVGFPDFLDPTNLTTKWWINEFKLYHQQQAFDGIWIDMNEPSNFGTNEDHPWYYDSSDHPDDLPLKCPTSGDNAHYDIPPYATASSFWQNGNVLATKTLCMFGTTMRGTQRFFDTKNLYGLSETISTYQAVKEVRGKRGAVVTRSTFPSSGRYAGHWLGDNTARWEDLQTSVIGAQEFNIFGIPYVGSDICGFIGTTTEELCLRWQQMGAFHSFSRNHNTLGAPLQDPAQWPTVAAATRKHNLFRYRHLPYLFSLHFAATLNGGTVVRPLFFEFTDEEATHNLSHQFLWGSNMLIVPVVTQGATTVDAYLPTGADWYSMSDSYYGTKVTSGHGNYAAPWDALIPVFLRAGAILPRQSPALSTSTARKNRFELVVGLKHAEDGTATASGELYWDDGEAWVETINTHNFYHFTYDFQYTSAIGTLTIKQTKAATGITLPFLDNIEIFGYPSLPDMKTFNLNGSPVSAPASDYSPFSQIFNITGSNFININTGKQWILQWKNH
jgi:alpha-glucosidase (family GH31 glycosyl hydrolase)